MKKILKIAALVIAAAIFLAVVGFVAWGLTPLGPTDQALAALESNESVSVEDSGDWITFAPTSNVPISAFIFYPGGHVDYRSYAPVAQRIAASGYMVTIVKMPLSLAVFGIDKADKVVAAYPDIQYWVIGGHSLGGSMAANYVKNHPDELQGLALWASYPSTSDDLSETELKGLSIYGSNDHVLNMDTYKTTRPLLPPETIFQVIVGGNHAQFGNYGLQPGDGSATISADEQQTQAAEFTVRLIRAVEGE